MSTGALRLQAVSRFGSLRLASTSRALKHWPAAGLANGDIDIGLLMLSGMLPEKDRYVVGLISTHASDPAGAKALLIWREAGYGPPER